jgi:hypothetical protein
MGRLTIFLHFHVFYWVKKTTDAEMDGKPSYNLHRALAKCIDFTLFV